MININVSGGSSATNVIDVFDQYTFTQSNPPINFRVKSNGYVYCRELNVTQVSTSFPDYVFEKGYALPTIYEVEKYVFSNKHLINIPSAKEVNSNGINIAEMQIKQMEKIEESFLYIIQLKKENDELKLRLDKLEGNK